MKSIFKSKTVWFNLVVAILTLFNQEFFASIGFNPMMQTLAITGVNFALRFVTNKGISVSGK